jgi:hypothetical protein
MPDPIEEARRLVEDPSEDWYAIEHARFLIEGPAEEDELERALRRAPEQAPPVATKESEWREFGIFAGFVLFLGVILFVVYGVPV